MRTRYHRTAAGSRSAHALQCEGCSVSQCRCKDTRLFISPSLATAGMTSKRSPSGSPTKASKRLKTEAGSTAPVAVSPSDSYVTVTPYQQGVDTTSVPPPPPGPVRVRAPLWAASRRLIEDPNGSCRGVDATYDTLVWCQPSRVVHTSHLSPQRGYEPQRGFQLLALSPGSPAGASRVSKRAHLGGLHGG